MEEYETKVVVETLNWIDDNIKPNIVDEKRELSINTTVNGFHVYIKRSKLIEGADEHDVLESICEKIIERVPELRTMGFKLTNPVYTYGDVDLFSMFFINKNYVSTNAKSMRKFIAKLKQTRKDVDKLLGKPIAILGDESGDIPQNTKRDLKKLFKLLFDNYVNLPIIVDKVKINDEFENRIITVTYK